ncbi:MAG: SCE4755 family polysaccharide monooxygenase-like protein [Myxococcota bacterium]
MLCPRTCLSLLVVSLGASISLAASAHVSLDSPKSRYYSGSQADQVKQKNGPCGVTNDSRTTNSSLITTFKPGQQITVKWRETIQHPGFFRIAFDSDGQDFTFPGSSTNGEGVTILAEKITDKSGSNGLEYTHDITLPNVECSKCTLQLVQVMTTSPPPYEDGNGNDLYFNCADIVLKADGGGSGGSSSGGASSGSGGSNSGGSNSGGKNSGGASGMSSGGSNASGGSGQGGANANGGASSANGGSNTSGGASSGGSNANGGSQSSGGAQVQGGSGTGGSNTSGGSISANGGSSSSSGGMSNGPSGPDETTAGCSCRVGQKTGSSGAALAVGLLALWLARWRKRAERRSDGRSDH